MGELFHAGLLGYYGQYTAFANISGLNRVGHHILGAGLGTFGHEPDVHTVMGLPMSINGGGAVMNIPILNVFGYDEDGSNGTRRERVEYVLQVGMLSSVLEHVVPESLFAIDGSPGEAVSAIRALEKAGAQGQPIYHITQTNQLEILPNVHHSAAVLAEIRNALARGWEVITHANAVSVPGWSGAGYILFDPITGDGAWKISGGQNGGLIFWSLVLAIAILATAIFFGYVIFVLGIAAVLAGHLSVSGAVVSLLLLTLAFNDGFQFGKALRNCGPLGRISVLMSLGSLFALSLLAPLPRLLSVMLGISTWRLMPDPTSSPICDH